VRPGEKLYEEANLTDEHLVPTSHRKIRSFVGPQEVDPTQMREILRELRGMMEKRDMVGLVHLLKRMIPDYSPSFNLLENAILAASEQAGSHAEAKLGSAFLTN
jgi:FlaA1/EpsC-like NDP-sugar epimerase